MAVKNRFTIEFQKRIAEVGVELADQTGPPNVLAATKVMIWPSWHPRQLQITAFMIRFVAKDDLFFIRGNSNAAVFTPYFEFRVFDRGDYGLLNLRHGFLSRRK